MNKGSVKLIVDSNFQERANLSPLEEAARKELFFVLTGRVNWASEPYLLESQNNISKDDQLGSYFRETEAIAFKRSDALTNITEAQNFSVGDLIKIFPQVVNQKYVWSNSGGKPYSIDHDFGRYERHDSSAPLFYGTALGIAAAFGTLHDVITMVENGADINPPLEPGQESPLDTAIRFKKVDVEKYLRAIASAKAEAEASLKNSPVAVAEYGTALKGDSPNVLPIVSVEVDSSANVNLISHTTPLESFSDFLVEPSAPLENSDSGEETINASPVAYKTFGSSKNTNMAEKGIVPKGFKKSFAEYNIKIRKDFASLDEDEKRNICGRLLYAATKNGDRKATLRIGSGQEARNVTYDISDLLAMKADPNYIDPDSKSGSTPLLNLLKNKNNDYISAKGRSYMEDVVALVEAGADVNYINNEGQSPLSSINIFKIEKGHIIVPKYLLLKGANPNHRADEYSRPPLNEALDEVRKNSGSSMDENVDDHMREARINAFNYCVMLVEAGAKLDEKFKHSNAYLGWEVNNLDLVKKLNPEEAAILVRTALRNGQEIDTSKSSSDLTPFGQMKKLIKIVEQEKLQFQNLTKVTAWPIAEISELTTGHSNQHNNSSEKSQEAVLSSSPATKYGSEEKYSNSKLSASEEKQLPLPSAPVSPSSSQKSLKSSSNSQSFNSKLSPDELDELQKQEQALPAPSAPPMVETGKTSLVQNAISSPRHETASSSVSEADTISSAKVTTNAVTEDLLPEVPTGEIKVFPEAPSAAVKITTVAKLGENNSKNPVLK